MGFFSNALGWLRDHIAEPVGSAVGRVRDWFSDGQQLSEDGRTRGDERAERPAGIDNIGNTGNDYTSGAGGSEPAPAAGDDLPSDDDIADDGDEPRIADDGDAWWTPFQYDTDYYGGVPNGDDDEREHYSFDVEIVYEDGSTEVRSFKFYGYEDDWADVFFAINGDIDSGDVASIQVMSYGA